MHVHVTLRVWVCTEYWQLAAINPCLSLPVSTLFVLVNNNLRGWGHTHTHNTLTRTVQINSRYVLAFLRQKYSVRNLYHSTT